MQSQENYDSTDAQPKASKRTRQNGLLIASSESKDSMQSSKNESSRPNFSQSSQLLNLNSVSPSTKPSHSVKWREPGTYQESQPKPAQAIQQPESDVGGQRVGKVFLMAKDQRYLPFTLFIRHPVLSFEPFSIRGEQAAQENITHDLRQIHVRSVDTADTKVVDKAGLYFCALLTTAQLETRKLYFLDFGVMKSTIEAITGAQGFESRFAQYETIQSESEQKQLKTKHRIIGAEAEFSIVPLEAEIGASQLVCLQEVKALQALFHLDRITQLIDVFEQEDHIVSVVKPLGNHTLDRVLKTKFAGGCSLEFARFTLISLIAIVSKIHSIGVMHRMLCSRSIGMKRSSSAPGGFKVDKLGAFDFAFILRNKFSVQQTFFSSERMAPEIEASQPHDLKADIWSLGQLAYQMLSQPNPSAPRFLGPEFEAHWLSGVPEEVKNLVELMVAPNPTLRPSCKVLLSHPWLKGLI